MTGLIGRAYALAWWLALPWVAGYLLWRARRQPSYRAHWGERFLGAGAPPPAGRPLIWIHAVSLGETRAAAPLLHALAGRYPQAGFLLTHMTPTGRAAGAELAAALPGRVAQRYLPYEIGPAQDRFFRDMRPDIGLLMETEVWPRLLSAARAHRVPMLLVNARLSERSAAAARRIAPLLRGAAAALVRIGAQTATDRARLAEFYRGPIDVLGNLKFDLTPDPAQLAAGAALRRTTPRPVWLFASTRDGEEALLLDTAEKMGSDPIFGEVGGGPRKMGSDPIFLVVPRHPQRFEGVAALARGRGWGVVARSAGGTLADLPARTMVLGDTVGEMAFYYAAADAALIGGSLLPYGAQNLIEACAAGTPVVLGPSTFNFAQAAVDAVTAGAALSVPDAPAALAALAALSADPARRAAMAEAGRAFAAAHRGATARTLALVEAVLADTAVGADAAPDRPRSSTSLP